MARAEAQRKPKSQFPSPPLSASAQAPELSQNESREKRVIGVSQPVSSAREQKEFEPRMTLIPRMKL
jgi:hypothetical protein